MAEAGVIEAPKVTLPQGSMIDPSRVEAITKLATDNKWDQTAVDNHVKLIDEEWKTAHKTLSDKLTPKVPEKYELKLDEKSRLLTLNPKVMEQISETAKKLGMTQEQTAALLQGQHETAEAVYRNAEDTHKANVASWEKTLREDKEVGGSLLKENAENADRALEHFFDKETLDYLKTTGYLGMPGIFKGFAKAGKLLANDKLVNGNPAPVKDNKTIAQKMFPNMPNP